MVKKRKFPEDWSGLTDFQVIENIKYLLVYYKDYEIRPVAQDAFFIGNVYFVKAVVDITENLELVYIDRTFYINKRRFFDYNNLCQALFDKCEQEAKVQEPIRKQKDEKLARREKMKDRMRSFPDKIGYMELILMSQIIILCSIIYKNYEKEKVQQYKEKQEQLINTCDSLMNNKNL